MSSLTWEVCDGVTQWTGDPHHRLEAGRPAISLPLCLSVCLCCSLMPLCPYSSIFLCSLIPSFPPLNIHGPATQPYRDTLSRRPRPCNEDHGPELQPQHCHGLLCGLGQALPLSGPHCSYLHNRRGNIFGRLPPWGLEAGRETAFSLLTGGAGKILLMIKGGVWSFCP